MHRQQLDLIFQGCSHCVITLVKSKQSLEGGVVAFLVVAFPFRCQKSAARLSVLLRTLRSRTSRKVWAMASKCILNLLQHYNSRSELWWFLRGSHQWLRNQRCPGGGYLQSTGFLLYHCLGCNWRKLGNQAPPLALARRCNNMEFEEWCHFWRAWMKAWKMHVINFDDNEPFLFSTYGTIRYSVMWEHIISHHDERDYVTAITGLDLLLIRCICYLLICQQKRIKITCTSRAIWYYWVVLTLLRVWFTLVTFVYHALCVCSSVCVAIYQPLLSAIFIKHTLRAAFDANSKTMSGHTGLVIPMLSDKKPTTLISTRDTVCTSFLTTIVK